MFVTNWISTTKIQKISEITNFFRHYFLSRTEVIMNNKLDKLIVEQLKLDNKSTSEKLQVIEDELENVQKLCERLEFLQEQYQEEYDEENFKE